MCDLFVRILSAKSCRRRLQDLDAVRCELEQAALTLNPSDSQRVWGDLETLNAITQFMQAPDVQGRLHPQTPAGHLEAFIGKTLQAFDERGLFGFRKLVRGQQVRTL